jgi:ligand-binding sensor domain-containing protein
MKKYFLFNPDYFLLAVLFFIVSCNGQNKTQPAKAAGELKITPAGNPKLVKTQGTDEFANIHCGLQDKAGNMWFGTTGEGVYRYDGKLFTQFTKKDGLTSNRVLSILEDQAGNIWIGTDSGLCRYDGKAITHVPIAVAYGPSFSPNNENAPSAKNEVWSIMQDKSGRLWFGTKDGMYCYNGMSFTRFLDNSTLVNNSGLRLRMVDCMLEDKDGDIWFASGMLPGDEGICRYDGKSLTSFKPEGDGWIRYLVEDKNGIIWIGTRHKGIWRYDGKTFSCFMKGNDIGLSCLADKAGNIWFSGGEKNDGYSSDGNIWLYDGHSLQKISSDNFGNYGVWCMIQDRNGYIWLGTRNTGLYRYDGKSYTSFSE